MAPISGIAVGKTARGANMLLELDVIFGTAFFGSSAYKVAF